MKHTLNYIVVGQTLFLLALAPLIKTHFEAGGGVFEAISILFPYAFGVFILSVALSYVGLAVQRD